MVMSPSGGAKGPCHPVYWGDANQVEQIKHKVDQRCSSMKDVWEALDKEYAQEEEVIIAVKK